MFHWRDKNKKRKVETEAVPHDEAPPSLPVTPPLQAFKGVGSSSKVLYQLGAPVTLDDQPTQPALRRRRSNDSADSSLHIRGSSSPPQSRALKSSYGPLRPSGQLQKRPSYGPDHTAPLADSRQSSAMSSDSLLHTQSRYTSSTSSIGAGDAHPISAPAHQIGFPEDPSKSFRRSSNKTNYSSTSHTKYQKHKPTHSPIPSVDSSTKTDQSSILSQTPHPENTSSSSSSRTRAIPHEQSAEDATEEIVPWMFDDRDKPDSDVVCLFMLLVTHIAYYVFLTASSSF